MNKHLFICCLIIFFISCKKDKEKSTRTIEGYIYQDCELHPLNNNITYTVEGINNNISRFEYTLLGTVNLDKNGYYKLTYETDKDFNDIRINEPGYGAVITLYGYQNQINTTHYINPKTKHQIIIHTSDSLSNLDTLYLQGSLNPTLLALAGPFYEGQTIEIEVNPNIGRANGNDFIYSERTGFGKFWWGIGWSEVTNRVVGVDDHFIIRGIPQTVCGIGGDIHIDLSIR